MYNPYFDREGEPRLTDATVCSLDLLGTQRGAQGGPALNLEITRGALAGAHDLTKELPSGRILTRWFSDNAVIAAADDSGHLQVNSAAVLLTAAAIQLEFADHGIFARGGIQFGQFFAEPDFVYGPALVDAYLLESQVAIYPRIVLSSTFTARLMAEVRELGDVFPADIYRGLVARDHDGCAFVNYLWMVHRVGEGEEEAWLDRHKTQVQQQLAAHAWNDKLSAKYRWVADYHDRFCRGSTNIAGEHEALVIGGVTGEILADVLEEAPEG